MSRGIAAARRRVTRLGTGSKRCQAPQSPKWHGYDVEYLGRVKHAARFSLPLAAIPSVKWRKLLGSYRYGLARKLD